MEPVKLVQHGKWMPADVQTPISLYLGFVGSKPGILLESAEVDGRLGRYSILVWDFRMKVCVKEGKLNVQAMDPRLKSFEALNGRDYLEGMKELIDSLDIEPDAELGELPPASRGLYGYLNYSMGGILEPKLASCMAPEDADSCLVLPGKVILFDHLYHRTCCLSLDEGPFPPMDRESIYGRMKPAIVGDVSVYPEEDEFKAGVVKAKEMITQGEAIQIVLSTRFKAPFSGNAFTIYRRLRQVNPSPFMFYMNFGEKTLLGSSPEMMVRSSAGRIELRPIAGTRPRGKDSEQDMALAEDLLNDPKEVAEHVMLVDLGRNDLGRMAKPGSVEVMKFMQVERFSHVMHITSYVEADLAEDKDAMDVLVSAFPAGTLSGAPKVRAMEIIAELENQDRGAYAGCIGWIGMGKDKRSMDTGITIRSMWVEDGILNWQAGAGLVYDSVPENEWQECHNKARVIRSILHAKEEGDVFAY